MKTGLFKADTKGLLLIATATLLANGAWADDDVTASDRFDRRGDRIEDRLDNRGERIDRHLDNKGQRVDRRLDNKGERVQNRRDHRPRKKTR